MYYPIPKTTTVYLTLNWYWYKKIVRLEIPQATIREVVEFYSLDNERKIYFLMSKIRNWGAGKDTEKLFSTMGLAGFENILSDTFFYKRELRKLPDSVIALATKEGVFDYDTTDASIFKVVAREWGIPPRELLEYTLDELYFMFEGIQYDNLNDKQKRELERIKMSKVISEQKDSIDASIDLLDNYFNNQQ